MAKLPTLKKVDVNKKKKKKILLLSDDMRMHSGVGTMSRELVLNSVHEYDWVQVGGAIKHPDNGQKINISQDVVKETGVSDASVVIYPFSGYGNPDLIRHIIKSDKPDAILHFTDPRFWDWLYNMEHEIRQDMPIFYYTIWDDLPIPHWNAPFYESCDWLGCISKQTYNIVSKVRDWNRPSEVEKTKDWQVTYLPHGVPEKWFKPIKAGSKSHDRYEKFVSRLLQYNEKYEYVLFYNNRNIRRKQTSDIILAWNEFCNTLTKEQASKCLLLMHTPRIDPNGTNLQAVKDAVCPDHLIMFDEGNKSTEELGFMYNRADATINCASNEGFGLSSAESIMCGTMIINNITGGLQDQVGFKRNGKYLSADDYLEIQSMHDRDLWKDNPEITWGEWALPIWPSNRSLQGSPQTPYIFDDRADYKEIAKAIKENYDMGRDERKRRGMIGHEWAMSEAGFSSRQMGLSLIEQMGSALENWTPRKRFNLYKIKNRQD